MKLRSIALAGLLGTGMLMTTGCDLLDEVEEALKSNVIYTTNGTTSTVTFSVTEGADEAVLPMEFAAYPLLGEDNYEVTYNGAASKSFPAGDIHHYVATDCNADGYLAHTASATKVHVVNLTDTAYESGAVQIKQVDGTVVNAAAAAPACSITAITAFDTITLENGMSVSQDGGVTWKVIDDIDQEYIDIANKVKFDLVSNITETTAVPMVGYEELIDAGLDAK